jgi:hypothetical protein
MVSRADTASASTVKGQFKVSIRIADLERPQPGQG